MSWTVLITAGGMDEVGRGALAMLEKAGCRLIHSPHGGPFDEEALLQMLEGVDAVLAGTDAYSGKVLASKAVERLKIISRWGVGYDSIDVAAATANGMVVAYTPGLTDEAVADFTMALLLAMARHVPEGHRTMHDGLWLRRWGEDMAGKTLGLLGLGRIGQAVARRGRGFGMKVIATDRRVRPEAKELAVEMVSFDELLARSDFLSLHVPMKPENRGLMNEAAFRKMKRMALLVNTARGPIVDEEALLTTLREGWIAGAALDVYAEEPLPAQHPFRSVANLLLSPHQASSGKQTGERVSMAAAQAIVDLMEGRRPNWVVNPDVFAGKGLRAKVEAWGGETPSSKHQTPEESQGPNDQAPRNDQ